MLADDRDWDHDLDAWAGWHHVGRGMLKDYQRFAELLNEGARDLGYDNVGTMWRAGYDMSPEEFTKTTDRLWSQVQPLYSELQCYTRNKLAERLRRTHAEGRHDPGAHHRQHVGAELGESLSDPRAVCRRRQSRREPAPRGAAQDGARRSAQEFQGHADAARSRASRARCGLAQRGDDGPALGRFLQVDRIPSIAEIVLREIDAAAPARSRRALPRERMADEHGRGRAHQDVHPADRGRSVHDLPRDGPHLLLPRLQGSVADLPGRRQRRLPRGDRRHHPPQHHAGVSRGDRPCRQGRQRREGRAQLRR